MVMTFNCHILAGQSFGTGKRPGVQTKKRKHSESNDDGLVEKRVSVQSPVQVPTGMLLLSNTLIKFISALAKDSISYINLSCNVY